MNKSQKRYFTQPPEPIIAGLIADLESALEDETLKPFERRQIAKDIEQWRGRLAELNARPHAEKALNLYHETVYKPRQNTRVIQALEHVRDGFAERVDYFVLLDAKRARVDEALPTAFDVHIIAICEYLRLVKWQESEIKS